MSDKVIYTVGGTVQAGGGIYISRDADEELLRLCRAGEFCYVLTTRQTGKSSLMVATIERLAAEGIRSVEIDLTRIGTELSWLTPEQWYLGLIEFIVDQLELDVDYRAWWDERTHLGPTQRLSQFLRQVVLERVSEPVVIFIDEIDSTLDLDFSDDFFAAIRACYNARVRDPAFKRLSFVLLGVATPSDLISNPQRTPFNIGRRMDLTDFTERQAIPLADGLGLPPLEAGRVLKWILDWTGGHPYLTQRLCAAAAASQTKSWDIAAVDELVEKTFFGKQSTQDSNLQFVRDMLTQRVPDKAAVLKTYRRIHAGKAVPNEERSPIKTHLKLSGIVKAEEGRLRVRNEIYRRVFDLAWVSENTAVNWASIVAGIAVFVALLAVGSILYNAWIGIQFQDNVANFHQADVPEERLAHLAKIFRLQGLFGPTDYDYQARELFYGLSREEQLALFNAYNVEDSDLIVVVKGLYITLADTDGTDSTRPLLEAMVKTLGDLKVTEETKNLEGEINSWLEGRKLARQDQYDDALAKYNKAIELNAKNPATLYERAKVLNELSQYHKTLDDLEKVIAIAKLAFEPTTELIYVPPISEFAATGQMRNAVGNLIDDNPDLISFLARVSDSEYPNLREFGLIPSLEPVRIDALQVVPVGWVSGVGHPELFINLEGGDASNCYTGSDCLQVTYKPEGTWGGIYWWPVHCGKTATQEAWEKVKNDICGVNVLELGKISKMERLVFWARGIQGGEVIEFKVGSEDVSPRPGRSSGKVTLTSNWARYEIGLTGLDLTNTIGMFSWVATDLDNPEGAVFYLDDIQFEGFKQVGDNGNMPATDSSNQGACNYLYSSSAVSSRNEDSGVK